jgi:predicted acyltransferase
MKGHKRWAFPLVVIGMNSIAAYLIADMVGSYIHRSFEIHFGPNFFRFAGDGFAPTMQGAAILLTYWLILLWMYRRKLFLKI